MTDRKNALGVLDVLESPYLQVFPIRCIEVRNRNARCGACAAACPSGALVIAEDGMIASDPSLCTGCGACATACPTCALVAQGPDDRELLERCVKAGSANDDRVVVASTAALDHAFGHYDPAKVTEVATLSRFDESMIVMLAACGAQSLTFVDGRDAAAGDDALIAQVVSGACELLEAWGAALEVTVQGHLPEEVVTEEFVDEERPVMRHENASIDLQVDPEAYKPMKLDAQGKLPQQVPNRRGRLLRTLNSLGEPSEQTVNTRLWGHVTLDTSHCQSCRLCAVFCPTGALVKFDEDGGKTIGIIHTPAKCVKCRCCETACPKQAISLSEDIFAPDLVGGYSERYEMPAPEIVVGKPTTVRDKMRKLLVGANQVNFA